MATESEKPDRRPTERVVLRKVQVLEVPEGVDPEKLGEAIRALQNGGRARKAEDVVFEAWAEVERVTALTKLAAIEAYAGKPGTPDAKEGVFRAPTVTSWKDAAVYGAPPLPLVERSVIE